MREEREKDGLVFFFLFFLKNQVTLSNIESSKNKHKNAIKYHRQRFLKNIDIHNH